VAGQRQGKQGRRGAGQQAGSASDAVQGLPRAARSSGSRRNKPASEQPGNSWRYLYQRLSEKEFQQLCGALLRLSHPDVRCFPVGMSDGGRDVVDRGGDRALIYQVKWSSKTEGDPVGWLRAAVKGERANIERLVRDEGATKYVLMTSVAGTSIPERGTMDRLDKELAALSAEYGVEMECLWQADIDSMVDSAPDELKWSYADMLVGHDLIRYLTHGSKAEGRAAEMREVLLRVMSTQWAEDAKVKFSQVDMDHLNIVDLFVDVQEELVAHPGNRADAFTDGDQARGEGAAYYLLRSSMPLTLVLGEPGQGKSTLGQYLCQVHRAAILPEHEVTQGKVPSHTARWPKLALRTDLRDYAVWLEGRDPFDEQETAKRVRRRGAQRSLENYLADFCAYYSGGSSVTVDQVQDFLSRYPTLIVLDGLDEVADQSLRGKVVDEINRLAQRMAGTARRSFQVIVTTRPNAAGLAEPSGDMFERIRLCSLSPSMQETYLRKWARVTGITRSKKRQLEKVFRERSAEDHIAQLAVNPMQLTILLYLINRRGESVPTARTPLYTQYMDTLLDREVEKSQIVNENIPHVHEVTSYLGWRMQGGVEEDTTAGRQTVKALEQALLVYLHEIEGPVDLAKTLFTAVTDRFWALTSKIDGTFEFSVQPTREYFAARFLAEYAGMWGTAALKQEILAEIVERPYWLNTARFFAGFAHPNELAGLVFGLKDALERGKHPLQVRTAGWALMADGIFASATRARREAAQLFTDDLSVRLIGADETEFPNLRPERGGREIALAYLEKVETSPSGPLARERAALLPLFGMNRDAFEDWWIPRLRASLQTSQASTWLALGAAFGNARLPDDIANSLSLADHTSRTLALRLSAKPLAGSAQESALLRAVLDGHASDTATASTCEAADLLKAIRPQHFVSLAKNTDEPVFKVPVGHLRPSGTERRNRSANFKRLVERDDRYKRLQRASAVRKGEKGTTAPWQNSARIIADIHGPCWLAAEIATIGAAVSGIVTGGSITRGGEPAGPSVDYGTFVEQSRANRKNPAWWTALHDDFEDLLSRRQWALALLCVADTSVVVAALTKLDSLLTSLDTENFTPLADASSRVGASGIARRLPDSLLTASAALTPRTQLLVAHHTADLDKADSLRPLSDQALTSLAAFGNASWAASQALIARIVSNPNQTVIDALTALGPDSITGSLTSLPLTDEWCAQILDRPESFPRSWVVAAEAQHSKRRLERAFLRLAVDEGWVPKLPFADTTS
jgi:hypothetical protein